VDRTQPHCPNRVITQGAKGRIKKIARDKGKAQEVVKSEKAQEVSKKRKAYNDMLFISNENVQKHLCKRWGTGRGCKFFSETTVTAE